MNIFISKNFESTKVIRFLQREKQILYSPEDGDDKSFVRLFWHRAPVLRQPIQVISIHQLPEKSNPLEKIRIAGYYFDNMPQEGLVEIPIRTSFPPGKFFMGDSPKNIKNQHRLLESKNVYLNLNAE